MHYCVIAFGIFCGLASLDAQASPGGPQGVVARLSTHPPLSLEEVANLEAKVQANPEDLESRMQLLIHYRDFAPIPPNDNPARRTARLGHILYLIEQHPEAADSASSLAYASGSKGPYANASDHELVRNLWLRQVEGRPDQVPVLLNAVKFLFIENKDQAEEQLKRALARSPDDHRIAANLGFLYAMDILGIDNFAGEMPAPLSDAERAAIAQRATGELESCSNAAVLAGAATALPNLSMRASRGTPVDPAVFELSSKLMARARGMKPTEEEFRGPMPMIRYFEEVMRSGQKPEAAQNAAVRIRVDGSAQAARLIRSVKPKYPEEASRGGITGEVRMDAVLARDGTVASLQVLSGHPLLIPAALEAVKEWVYQPTVLNGAPVEVSAEIVVSFPPN